jgi:HK97 family phage prohead protease
VTEFRNDGVLPVERRFVATPSEFRPELRKVAGDANPHIAGYGSVYNKLSRNLGGFVERVNPGSFRNAEGAGWPDVVCRYNHSDDYLLGTTKSGTLQLRTDGTGLFYDVIPPSFRSDILELCERGDITSSSFAFRVPDGGDDWTHSSDFGGMPLRTLLDLELVDVAPVNTPAYPDATAFARSLEGAVESLAYKFDADPAEIRSLLANKQAVKLFKRSDRPSVAPSNEEATVTDEARAKISTASKNDLPDSAFAYIEPGGEKDESGKTTPRSKRHFPIHDEAHIRNALSRIGQGAQFGKEALPKVKAAAKAKGIGQDDKRELEDDELVLRAIAEESDLRGLIFDEDDEERAKKQLPPWLQKKGDDTQDDSSDADSGDDGDDDSKDKKSKPVQKRDNSNDEDQDTPADDSSDDEEDDDQDEQRSAPDAPEDKADEAEDDKEKAEAEAEVKAKMDKLEHKRRMAQLMEKRYDPWFFDGE